MTATFTFEYKVPDFAYVLVVVEDPEANTTWTMEFINIPDTQKNTKQKQKTRMLLIGQLFLTINDVTVTQVANTLYKIIQEIANCDFIGQSTFTQH